MAANIIVALIGAVAQTTANIETEGFERGFGGWVVDSYVGAHGEPLEYSVTRSQVVAHTGAWSLNFTAAGYHDDGTVWIERGVDLPAGRHDVELSWWVHSEEAGQIGLWESVGYIGGANPETEGDFTILGELGLVAGWSEQGLSRTVELAAPGRVWVALGYNIVFEVIRTHHFDDVTLTVKPGCAANCDGSTTAPILNVADFACFLNRFAAGDAWANCDGSTAAPVLNIQDFACFLNRVGAGCG